MSYFCLFVAILMSYLWSADVWQVPALIEPDTDSSGSSDLSSSSSLSFSSESSNKDSKQGTALDFHLYGTMFLDCWA